MKCNIHRYLTDEVTSKGAAGEQQQPKYNVNKIFDGMKCKS